MNSKWFQSTALDFKAILYFILVLTGGIICFNVKEFLTNNNDNEFIHLVLDGYLNSMLNLSYWFSERILNNINPVTGSLLFGPDFPVNLGAFSIQLIIIIGLSIILVPNNLKTKVLLGLSCLFVGLFLGILRMSIMLTWDIRQYPFWFQTMSSFSRFLIYFSVILIVLYFLRKNKIIFEMIKEKLFISDNEKLFALKVITIFILYFLINLLIFHPKLSLDDYFASFIMSSSHHILNIISYKSTFIYPRIIKFDNGGIFMGNPCLGVNLMLIYITAIVLIGRKLNLQFRFIVYGVLGIIGLNILRISVLYIYLFENTGQKTMFLKSHDLFNWVVYGFIFLMLYYWIQKQKRINSSSI